MKPDTSTAMRELIRQVREALPFDAAESQICAGPCHGCPQKLLTYLDTELDDWERRLDAGDKPDFADLSRLAKTSRRVQGVLEKNGLDCG